MGGPRSLFVLPLLLLFLVLSQSTVQAEKKSFVVYFGAHSHDPKEISLESEQKVANSHYEFLASFLGSKEKAQDSIFYSYTKYINGFAAILEEQDAKKIAQHPNVISVFPNRGHKLHTTRSWDFLGLERNGMVPARSIWGKTNYGENVIIGNLDTGVWPESESFRDDGMGPVPTEWKGECENHKDSKFHCNRKLIGARFFNQGYLAYIGSQNATRPADAIDSPRDTDGHGTHTLSTAAGRLVPSANLFGYGNGTAKGGAPNARVAAYKVCWPQVDGGECFDADILAAFDHALFDGVNVLSVSLGGLAGDYFDDGIAIGSFHAVKHGITVVCSAGNSGPDAYSVANVAPWILTVGASTLDREFQADVLVDDTKMRIKGQSLSASKLPAKKFYPFISSADAKFADVSEVDAMQCVLDSLDPKKVKGKIVVCIRGSNARVEKGETVLQAGGVGMVLANDESTGNEIIADAHVLPATHISYSDGVALLKYLNSTRSALGHITAPETKLATKPAPFMAAFSSQGPNPVNEEILKPDITAPGVSILAAYSEATSPTGLDFDKRRVLFNSESGTSMSCPHIAGVAGLLKAAHPGWSPSAIRSAIMTTAIVRDNTHRPIEDSSSHRATPFAYGSGHVHPNRAVDPGLIYDLSPNDYLNFLCMLGYNSTQIATFSHPYKCPEKPIKIEDLNYPSIAVPNLSGKVTLTRRVKNVGTIGTYQVHVEEPRGVSVSVEPTKLEFCKLGEEKEFKVVLEARSDASVGDYVFGALIWKNDGRRGHHVRSPIAVRPSGQ
ncbi:Subtilisin-like protease [Rhynchospora pubera]|uniref:Subtilisin-like protease n=1 Tax=Rhynchospora pubera TaxID=906938 RepID=A0AAV8BYB9_9POAL|nr:Subtilisin-like protease [Rhynchospora pubera]